jgi:hypothetical protein
VHCSGHGPCAMPEALAGAWTPEIPAELGLGPTSLVWTAYFEGKYPADLRRCATPLCAGGPITLVSKEYDGVGSHLVVSGRYVYWTKTSEGTVKRCLLTGCDGKPEILARDQSQPRAIALHAGVLYFANYASGEIMKLVPPP